MTKMINRKNVIKGLQIERECVSRDCDRDCGKCDLVQDRDWLLSVYDDAITLLKEQEPVESMLDVDEWRCGNCSHKLEHQVMLGDNALFHEQYNYCPDCGRKVKWE